MIKILDTGLVYRNPTPHVHSVQATFPSAVTMDNGEMLCSLVLGEAFEAPNARAHVARSTDGGRTWALEGPICPLPARRITSDAARIAADPGGEVVAMVTRADRTARPHEGLANPTTLGFAPTEVLLVRSRDYGRTWQPPRRIRPPLEGPEFEICCPIVPLSDGRWLYPTSTWCDWDGRWPSGKRMVAFVSRDRGRTWPEHLDVMVDPRQRIRYWESKIAELPDGRLLAVAWAYDETAGRDLPNQYAVSADGGHSWTRPRSMGLRGQTLTPYVLPDGRVLIVYRRMDEPGLWAVSGRLRGSRWTNVGTAPLWGARTAGLTGRSRNMAHNFSVLRLGAPCLCRTPDGTLFLAFWCTEDTVLSIRWMTLRV